MINAFYCNSSVYKDVEVLTDDQYQYSIDIWCYGDNLFGDCILELRAYYYVPSQRGYKPKTVLYAYTLRKRESFYDLWPRTLAYDTTHKDLESAKESAFEALLAYDPSLERF